MTSVDSVRLWYSFEKRENALGETLDILYHAKTNTWISPLFVILLTFGWLGCAVWVLGSGDLGNLGKWGWEDGTETVVLQHIRSTLLCQPIYCIDTSLDKPYPQCMPNPNKYSM